MIQLKDIQIDFKYKEPVKTLAHINSKNGDMEEVSLLGEAKYENQTIYITEYKGKKYLLLCMCILY